MSDLACITEASCEPGDHTYTWPCVLAPMVGKRDRNRIGNALCAVLLAIQETAGRVLDALLGPRCAYGCGQRLYPRDIALHEHYDHAGDRLPGNAREAGA